MRPASLVLMVLLVGLAAGCGGAGRTYSASATGDCLNGTGAEVDREGADAIAQDAGDGGFVVSLDGERGNIAIEQSDDEAADTLDAYRAAPGGDDEEAIYRKGNAVLSWDAPLTTRSGAGSRAACSRAGGRVLTAPEGV